VRRESQRRPEDSRETEREERSEPTYRMRCSMGFLAGAYSAL